MQDKTLLQGIRGRFDQEIQAELHQFSSESSNEITVKFPNSEQAMKSEQSPRAGVGTS